MKKNYIHNITVSQLRLINLKRIVFVLILTLLVVACKKNPPLEPEPTGPIMPPLTHEGANTFGCYIDGELFVANEGESVWSIPPVSGSFDEETNKLVVQGTRYRNGLNDEYAVSDNVRFRAYISENIGDYMYSVLSPGEILGYNGWGECDYYYNEPFSSGMLTISYLDRVKNIISGTFHINLSNPDCPEDTLLQITDGRFDFRY